MQQIFVNENPIECKFIVKDEDMHHLVRVVRVKRGETIRVSTLDSTSYLCEVMDFNDDELILSVISEVSSTELSNKIYLFQAIPKGDRMETIIEKCVELGVYEIVPVEMKNCIVRLDDKKRRSKLMRYQTIAKTAAMQSKRSIIPRVNDVMSFKEALDYASSLDVRMLPYENQNGIDGTGQMLDAIKRGESVGVFIGPEGGFDPSEIDMAKDSCKLISLGRRILRTDTAAICTLSLLMLKCEEYDDLL